MNIRNIFRDPPVLYTERLTLRRMVKGDYADMFEYSKDTEITKYLSWDPHPDKNYTQKYLTYVQSKYRSGEFHDWAIIHKGKMIGTCGFTSLNERHLCGEIGYVVSSNYHNMGIATEAARRVIQFGFEDLGLHRIEARFVVQNIPSQKVMEKLGMTFEGTLRDSMFIKGKYESIGVYSILRSEFCK